MTFVSHDQQAKGRSKVSVVKSVVNDYTFVRHDKRIKGRLGLVAPLLSQLVDSSGDGAAARCKS